MSSWYLILVKVFNNSLNPQLIGKASTIGCFQALWLREEMKNQDITVIFSFTDSYIDI